MAEQRRAILKIEGPDLTFDKVEITEKGYTVGRLKANDLPLESSKISRYHARFELTDESLTVTDLDSSNGTIVGAGRILPNKPVTLKIGDVIQFGPFRLTYEQLIDGKELPPSALPEQPAEPPPPPELPSVDGNGHKPPEHLVGLPREGSTWTEYLPSIFSENEFVGRFLLVFESIHAPLEWVVDNFDCYLDAQMTPPEWLQWFGGWVDILVPQNLPVERQRAIVLEMSELFLARGTRKSLARHLELVFSVKPEISEPEEPYTFSVKLPLGKGKDTEINREIAQRIIESQRPAYTRYTLEIV